MPDPINYGAGLRPADPAGSFQQGFAMTEAFQAQAAQRQAAEAQARQQAELKALQQKVISGQGTPADRAQMLMMVAPEQAKAFQGAFDGLDKAVKEQSLTELGKVYAAFESGNSEIAVQMILDRAEGKRNSGDEEGALLLEKMAEAEKTQPGQGANFVANQLALVGPEGQAIMESVQKQRGAPGERGLTEAKTAEAWANAFRMRMENERGVPLSQEADKVINMATDAVNGSLLLSTQAENLANAYDAQKPPAGWAGSALDWARKALGGQGVFDSLRQEYVKLRNTDVLKNLPPGVASDRDIEIALKAFPDENANPAQLSAFLRGTAKLHRYTAEVNKAKAEWVSQNGNLGPARSPLTVGETEVEKGTSFWDFTKAIPIPNVAPGAATPPAPGSGGAPSGKFGATGTPAPAAPPASGTKVITGEY